MASEIIHYNYSQNLKKGASKINPKSKLDKNHILRKE